MIFFLITVIIILLEVDCKDAIVLAGQDQMCIGPVHPGGRAGDRLRWSVSGAQGARLILLRGI